MFGIVLFFDNLCDPCTGSFDTVCAASLTLSCLGPPMAADIWYQVADCKMCLVKMKLIRSALLEF